MKQTALRGLALRIRSESSRIARTRPTPHVPEEPMERGGGRDIEDIITDITQIRLMGRAPKGDYAQ